jgi:hypothetical protein
MYGSAGSVTRCRPINVGFIIDSTALHGANYFGLALSRALAKWAKAIERSLSASATVGPCLEFNSLPVVEMDEDRRIHAETDQPRSPTEALKKAFPGSIGPGTPLFSSSGPGSSRSVRPGESSPSICRSDCHPDFKGTDLIITSGMVF